MSLEKGRHLSISRTGSVEDHEVQFEACGVDDEWDDEQSDNSGHPMFDIGSLYVSRLLQASVKTYKGHGEITKFLPQILDSVHTHHGHGKHSNPLDTTHTTNGPTGKD